jgi:hypothetical protein
LYDVNLNADSNILMINVKDDAKYVGGEGGGEGKNDSYV